MNQSGLYRRSSVGCQAELGGTTPVSPIFGRLDAKQSLAARKMSLDESFAIF